MTRAFHENPRWQPSPKRDEIKDARWNPMALDPTVRDEVWIRWNVAWCYIETRCKGVHGMQPSKTTHRFVDGQRNTYLICRVCGFIVTEDGLRMVRHDIIAARRRMRDAKAFVDDGWSEVEKAWAADDEKRANAQAQRKG